MALQFARTFWRAGARKSVAAGFDLLEYPAQRTDLFRIKSGAAHRLQYRLRGYIAGRQIEAVAEVISQCIP